MHRGKVTCGVFNHDATRILTCDESGVAQLWNAATGHADGAPYQHKGPVSWVDFHPDGQRVVTVSGAAATVWSVADRRKPLATITHGGKGKSELRSARFSPNGKWLATASTDGTARIWDAKTYKRVAEIDRHFPVLCVRFSLDSSRLVVGGEDAQAAVYDTATWKVVGVPVLANLTDDLPKLVYADWLEERGDERGVFLREFVAVARSGGELPEASGQFSGVRREPARRLRLTTAGHLLWSCWNCRAWRSHSGLPASADGRCDHSVCSPHGTLPRDLPSDRPEQASFCV